MNNLKTYFASPEKRRSKGVAAHKDVVVAAAAVTIGQTSELNNTTAAVVGKTATETSKENGQNGSGGGGGIIEENTSPLYVIKKPSADSKLILQNMEEVLNSVKKKHRQKHRRKREQKKLAQLEAEAVAVNAAAKANQEEEAVSSEKEQEQYKREVKPKAHSKKPLREKTEQMMVNNGNTTVISNGVKSLQTSAAHNKSPLKSPAAATSPQASTTVLQHFKKTAKKGDNASIEVIEENGTESSVRSAVKPKANAFEVLMNARNKTIGSNTPGKELTPADDEAATTSTAANVRRKLMLQEWSERKGGAKRKLEEEERAAYVNKQLEQRAKRFKKMLVTGSSPHLTDSMKEQPAQENAAKQRRTNKKQTRKESTATTTPTPTLDANEVVSEKPKRKRGRTSKRLISEDSSQDALPAPKRVEDPETAEFLAKLSSPTKKRDSLLGYFPKKESPKLTADEAAAPQASNEAPQKPAAAAATEAEVVTPKRGRRVKAAQRSTATNQQEETTAVEVNADVTQNTPGGRPRRSCAGKARYDYDLQPSPSKPSTPKTNNKLNTAQVMQDDESLEMIIIDLDDSNSSKTTPQATPNKKLAPLFVRSLPKPSPDPAMLKARQAFLMSGVPEKMRLEMAKQKQYEQNFEDSVELFPKLTHVRQFSSEEQQLITASINISFRLAAEASEEEEAAAAAAIAAPLPPTARKSRRSKSAVVEKTRSLSELTSSRMSASYCFASLNPPPLPSLPNKRNIIKDWKLKYDRFPTYKCYNQMREKYRYFSAIDSEQDTEQVTESFVVTRRSMRHKTTAEHSEQSSDYDGNGEDDKPPATAPNGELLFTDKYRPLLFEQFLVNLSPVSELREFLSNWSLGSSSARNSQGLDESTVDFDMDSNSNSSQHVASNTVVLVGPGSSGKTSAVFAIANELNLNVLEINAGMKRTGKKLLQELHEATQSHQIRKDTRSTQGKAKNPLLKMASLNGIKSRTKSNSQNLDGSEMTSSPGSSSSADANSAAARKCLILIEDADIVFDQMDAGFTDAIYTLAASSKRPVIIVASDMQCSHLQRLMQQHAIYFNEPSTMNISKYMAVLALMENCPVELEHLISLYIYNRRNLRKTLLELQFFIQSGGDRSAGKESDGTTGTFFASPTKRKFAEDSGQQSMLGTAADDALNKDVRSAQQTPSQPKLYTHQGLFKFYTSPQNEVWRIPYPIDFNLLHENFEEILRASPKLSAAAWASSNAAARNESNATFNCAAAAKSSCNSSNAAASSNAKRKTRSPKKVWLTAAAAQQTTPLEDLSDFYENLSIACLLGARGGVGGGVALQLHHERHAAVDRLVTHLDEDIAHDLVERSIDCNLEAKPFDFNLNHIFEEKQPLLESLGFNVVRSQRVRALDFEPALRSICRSEKLRASLERRSTRFYHYLRNGAGSSTAHFDEACEILSNAPAAAATADEAVEGSSVDATPTTTTS